MQTKIFSHASPRRLIAAALLVFLMVGSLPYAGEEASEKLDVIRRVIGERGEYDLAERQLRAFIDEYRGRPAAAEALVLLGYCQDKQKKNTEAAAAYSRVLEEYPNAPAQLRSDAALGAADAYFRLGRYKEAIADYALVMTLATKPEQAEAALLWRGEANYRLGLEETAAGRPSGALTAAGTDFAAFMERYPDSKLMASAVAGAAFAAFDAGEYAKSLGLFQRFTRDYPTDRRAEECLYYAAEALYRLNRYDEAKTAFDDLLAKSPTGSFAADARAGSAWADYGLKRIREAAAGFAEASKLAAADKEQSLSLLYDAGCAWREAGDIQKAGDALLEVAKESAHPLNALAWFRLGTLWQEQARAARERAEAAADPAEREKYRALQKDVGGKAVPYFRRALAAGKLKDEEVEARALLAETLLDAGNYAEAAEAFAEVARRWPDSERAPWALYHQALAERELSLAAGKDETAARDSLRRAAAALRETLKYPDAKIRPQAALALADYLSTLDDVDEARGQWRWLASESRTWARNWRGKDGRGDPALENRAAEYAADSLFRLGESYYAAPDYPRAAGFYQEIIAKYPDSPQAAMAQLRLGEIAENGRDNAAALTRYEEALKLGQRLGKARVGTTIGYAQLRLGALQLREGQREKAEDARRRRLQDALRNLSAVMADPPAGVNLSRPSYYLAETKYGLGLKREALADYESAVKSDAKGELADASWFGLAWTRRDLGDAAGAVEACRRVVEDFPGSQYRPEALALLASIHRAGGDSAAALADLDKLLAEYSGHPLAARAELERASALDETGRHAEAAEAFGKFLAAHPEHLDVPQALYQRSWALWNRIRPRAAEARAAEAKWRELTGGRAVAELPEGIRPEAERAEREMKNLAAEVAKAEDEILSALRDLTARYPDYPVTDAAWLRIGEILYDRGDYQQALAAYQKSLSLAAARNSDIADKAQYRLAWSVQRLAEQAERASLSDPDRQKRETFRKDMWDRRVAAIDAFETIIGRYPKSDLLGDACFRAAELRRRSGQDNADSVRRSAWFQSAAQRYRQALEKDGQRAPYRAAAEYGEGLCLLLDDKSTEAREIFRRLLLNPDGPYVQEAYWGLGQASLNLGAYADAAAAFEQALAVDRTTETAAKSRYGLGMTAALSGDRDKARTEFLDVDLSYSQYPEWAAAALVRAARTALDGGEKEKAIRDLERILARYPDTPAAGEARELQTRAMAPGGR